MNRREWLKVSGLAGVGGLAGYELFWRRQDEPGSDPTVPDDVTPRRRPEPAPSRVETSTVQRDDQTTVTDGEADGETVTDGEETGETPTDSDSDGDCPAESLSFETVVDAVEEGADPTGEEPVNFLFDQYGGDDTLLKFEPGTYAIDYFTVADRTRFGIVGAGAEPATFVPSDGRCRGGHPWVFFDDVAGLHLENILFDFRGVEYGGPLHLFLRGNATVRDVTSLGSCSNQLGAIRVDVRDEQGSATFENVVSRNVDENNTLTGIFVGERHAGELTLRDCTLERFSDNGLYASAPGGPGGRDGAVHVVGGTYANNNVANVRLGSTGSSATDVTIRVDRQTHGWGQRNARGIRLRNTSGQVIDGCDIYFGPDAGDSFGGIVFHPANGGATVRDTKIGVDAAGVPALRAFPAEAAADTAPVFETLGITGSAATGVTSRIEGRDGTTFDNCRIEQTGQDRRGLFFQDSRNCRIVDSIIDVPTAAVIVENGTVSIENSTVRTDTGTRSIDSLVLEDETLDV